MPNSIAGAMGRCLLHEETPDGWLEVWQDGERRSLWFADEVLQTEIDLSDPAHLPNPANRAMLAHLMFGQEPRRVLLAGCGGGGIARWFSARAPRTQGIAVERSSDVARIAREQFQFPTPDQLWVLEHADVRDRLPDFTQSLDFILVDIAVRGYSPEWATEATFLTDCREALTDVGVLTINLLPRSREDFAAQLLSIRQHFSRRTLCLSVPEHDNVLVLAFRSAPDLDGVEDRLPERQSRWGLEFKQLLARMRRENPAGSGIL